MTGRHRDLDTYSHRLNVLADSIPHATAHLDEQRANMVVLTARAGGSGTSGYSNPTLRAVLQLNHIDTLEADIDEAIENIALWIKTLSQRADRARRYRIGEPIPNDPDTDEPKPRCIGDGTPTGAACHQIPTPRIDRHTSITIDDGRCIDCGPRFDLHQAARRHERANTERLRYHNQKHRT